MRRSRGGDYPSNWKEIAHQVKEEAGWRCVRCGVVNGKGHWLTVHHLDMNPANCAWWNLAALCQKCHLVIQAKVVMERVWMFEHSEWFKPYVAGWVAHRRGYPEDKGWVLEHLAELLRTSGWENAREYSGA